MNKVKFKVEDAASYDEVAGIFDELTEAHARPLARALAGAIDAPARRRVLDIGCGTGLVAFEVARQAGGAAGNAAGNGPENADGRPAEVIGIDLSEGMLSAAAAKAPEADPAGRVSFRRGDAEALDLPDGYADGYVSLYAYRHFPHPDRAAAEAFRVLAPGGRCAIAIGSAPRLLSVPGMGRAAAALARMTREGLGRERAAPGHLDALVARHVPSVPVVETSEWSDGLSDPSGRLMEILAGAGFADLRRDWVGARFDLPDTEAFWRLQTTLSTPSRKRMALAAPGELAALKEAFWRDCEAVLARGGRLTYRIGAALLTCRKPG